MGKQQGTCSLVCFLLVLWMWCGVVLSLQVNCLWSSVVNVGFAEIVNSGLDGVSLDALHALWIWRAQLGRVGGKH